MTEKQQKVKINWKYFTGVTLASEDIYWSESELKWWKGMASDVLPVAMFMIMMTMMTMMAMMILMTMMIMMIYFVFCVPYPALIWAKHAGIATMLVTPMSSGICSCLSNMLYHICAFTDIFHICIYIHICICILKYWPGSQRYLSHPCRQEFVAFYQIYFPVFMFVFILFMYCIFKHMHVVFVFANQNIC